MNWYKQADFMGQDPYKVDFASEEAKAKRMDTDTLLGALSDAIEAAGVSANQGKYTDQASVYRKELLTRGMSVEEQDAKVKEIPSLHSNPFEDGGSEEDFASTQDSALSSEIKSYIYKLFSNNTSLSLEEVAVETLDAFLDEEDFVNAPEYAQKIQSLIKTEINNQKQAKQESEDWDSQAGYEAEMGRDTYQQPGDGYETLEDTSPCKDKITRERTKSENPSDHTFNYYPNQEKTNHFSPIV